MKLYIGKATCSRAPQIVLNEAGQDVTLILYDIPGRATSSHEDFEQINRFRYVPVLELDDEPGFYLSEASIITTYLADAYPELGLIPPVGTLERLKVDQTLNFIATEIAQKHIPLIRKHMNEEGRDWTLDRLAKSYAMFDEKLSDGRQWIAGDQFGVLDIYLWSTMWQDRSGARIDHLPSLLEWKSRVEDRPSVQKALMDEAALVAAHVKDDLV